MCPPSWHGSLVGESACTVSQWPWAQDPVGSQYFFALSHVTVVLLYMYIRINTGPVHHWKKISQDIFALHYALLKVPWRPAGPGAFVVLFL